MTQEQITTISLNGPLAKRIEDFLREHGVDESLEDFVVNAGRSRLEELATRQDARQPMNGRSEEEYSCDAVEKGSDALNKPLSDEEKSRVLKDLAASFRRLKNESNRPVSGEGGSI